MLLSTAQVVWRLKPYDRAIVRIEKINPREDKLTLSLVKLL